MAEKENFEMEVAAKLKALSYGVGRRRHYAIDQLDSSEESTLTDCSETDGSIVTNIEIILPSNDDTPVQPSDSRMSRKWKNIKSNVSSKLKKIKCIKYLLKRGSFRRRKFDRLSDYTDIKLIYRNAQSNDRLVQLHAIVATRKLSQQGRDQIEEIVANGMITILAECLRNRGNDYLQAESAWAFNNITGIGNKFHRRAALCSGAIPYLLQLLKFERLATCDAVFTLGNIIEDGPDLQNYLIGLGVVPLLATLLRPSISSKVLMSVVSVIRSLCHSRRKPSVNIMRDFLPALFSLFSSAHSVYESRSERAGYIVEEDDTSRSVNIVHSPARMHQLFVSIYGPSWEEDMDLPHKVMAGVMHALSFLTEKPSSMVQMIISSDIFPVMVPLLSHDKKSVQVAAMRAVSKIVSSSNDRQMLALLNCGTVSHFPKLATLSCEEAAEEFPILLCNVVSGGQRHIQAVIDVGLLPTVIDYLKEDRTKRCAALAISRYMTLGNTAQMVYLVDQGVIPPLCNIFTLRDREVLYAVLDGLLNLLMTSKLDVQAIAFQVEDCGGAAKLATLLRHKSRKVSKLAGQVFDVCFPEL